VPLFDALPRATLTEGPPGRNRPETSCADRRNARPYSSFSGDPSGDRVGAAITLGSQCRLYTNSFPCRLTARQQAGRTRWRRRKPQAFASFWPPRPAAVRLRRPRSGDRHRARFGAPNGLETSLCRRRGETARDRLTLLRQLIAGSFRSDRKFFVEGIDADRWRDPTGA
jgi:hypothetical protein